MWHPYRMCVAGVAVHIDSPHRKHNCLYRQSAQQGGYR